MEDEENGNILKENQMLNSTSKTQDDQVFTAQAYPLKRSEAAGYDYKKLNRGISRATDNVNLVSQVRTELVLDNIEQDFFVETPVHTFTLPNIFAQEPVEFRAFLEKDLMAISTQQSLEQANRLNWWTSVCQRLWPLSTSGDGNCLLHAASLAMWGFHDRLLTLRKALHAFLSSSPRREALWRRWRRQQSLLNAQAGLVYTEVEWRQEWNAIVNMASTEPRLRRLSVASDHSADVSGGDIYESLEEIHVLALAHVLRRPIIVVADTVLKDMNGEALAPIPFGGIYLPLECSPSECHRSPLLLAYDGGHFSALVAMDAQAPAAMSLASAIPLTDSTHDLLPIQFSIDPEDREDFGGKMELSQSESIELLKEYLDVIRIDEQEAESRNGILGSIGKSVGQKLRLKLSRSNSQRQNSKGAILCAALHTEKRHDYLDKMLNNYLHTARIRFQHEQEKKHLPGGEPRYGAGKSQFYAEADPESHDRVSQLTPVKPATNQDPTVYLCKSTFYETNQLCLAAGCSFFGNPQTSNYCSKCYRQLLQDQYCVNSEAEGVSLEEVACCARSLLCCCLYIIHSKKGYTLNGPCAEPNKPVIVPAGLQKIMSDIAKEVIRERPINMLPFIANFLNTKIEDRTNFTGISEFLNSNVIEAAEEAINFPGIARATAIEAAKKIQAICRGYKTRIQQQANLGEETPSSLKQTPLKEDLQNKGSLFTLKDITDDHLSASVVQLNLKIVETQIDDNNVPIKFLKQMNASDDQVSIFEMPQLPIERERLSQISQLSYASAYTPAAKIESLYNIPTLEDSTNNLKINEEKDASTHTMEFLDSRQLSQVSEISGASQYTPIGRKSSLLQITALRNDTQIKEKPIAEQEQILFSSSIKHLSLSEHKEIHTDKEQEDTHKHADEENENNTNKIINHKKENALPVRSVSFSVNERKQGITNKVFNDAKNDDDLVSQDFNVGELPNGI